jgi:hypothetical protein
VATLQRAMDHGLNLVDVGQRIVSVW